MIIYELTKVKFENRPEEVIFQNQREKLPEFQMQPFLNFEISSN